MTVAVQFGTVIVIDDGSTDKTGDIARSSEATVIRHNERQVTKSIESGFALAQKLRAVAVVTMDADGEHDPNLLARFHELLVAKGSASRWLRPNQPRLAEYAMGKIFRWRYGIADARGMKGYRTELYRENGGLIM